MRLMTRSELAGRNEQELSALFQAVAGNLVRTERDRRNGLATLENIRLARIALVYAR